MNDWDLYLLLLALVADWRFGEPSIIWSKIPHPVIIFGKGVAWVDEKFNLEEDKDGVRYRKGAIAIVSLILMATIIGWLFSGVFDGIPIIGFFVELFLVFTLLAQKSLLEHLIAVGTGLRENGIEGGRKAVGLIVGRDTTKLDQCDVCRAAIESGAENFSDGIVAPAFWYCIFGLPGLFAYKMINTADSMIGYHNDRYEYFGKVAAQIDDLANWFPARLSALIIGVAAYFSGGMGSVKKALGIAVQDAGLHRSPNAGWPEGAVAGALEIALGGPRIYQNGRVNQAYLNASGRQELGIADILRAVGLIERACFVLWGLIFFMLIF